MSQQSSPHGSRIALVIGVLFCAIGCFGVVGSWGAYRLDSSIEQNGQRAEGHITQKSRLLVSDGDSDFTVDYWFQLPTGERIDAHRGVTKELWSTLYEREPLIVLYSAENPNRNFPQGGGVTSIGVTVFVSAIFTILAAFGALLVVGFFSKKQT